MFVFMFFDVLEVFVSERCIRIFLLPLRLCWDSVYLIVYLSRFVYVCLFGTCVYQIFYLDVCYFHVSLFHPCVHLHTCLFDTCLFAHVFICTFI